MGGYQLSLQGGSYNPADAKNLERSMKTGSPRGGFGLFQSKRVASQHNLERLMAQASAPRHSTACCDGLSMQRESSSLQRTKVSMAVQQDLEPGHSFRSDDSDNLALWEEMEPTYSTTAAARDGPDRDGWVKLTTQSPRWLDAMAKLAPWRSSPVHPKLCDTPRVSLDRMPSTRSLHDSTKAWYSKKSRSVWSPKLTNSAKWDHDSEEGSKHGSFSRMMDEDTRFTASAVAWDISTRPEPTVAKPTRPVSDLLWEIPGDAKTIDTVTDNADDSSSRSEAFFDGQSEYASCRTFVEDELLTLPESTNESTKSANDVGFVNVIDFVAPLLTKLQSIEKKEDSRRVSFKWEAAGPKLPAEEVAPTTETPQPPPVAGASSYETLRQEYILKSKSAPLDGLYVFLPQSGSPLPWVKSLEKSKSYNGDGALRRVNSSPDHRLFRTAPGPSPLGINIKNDSEYCNESGSPRSILRGPDDGSSVPSSSNPSLRSDRPQSMSSCSASFDLNEGDYDMISSYNLNSSAACIIVESRRVSLSFRDFGTGQPDCMAEASESSSNVELLGCDHGQLDTTSPELWTATFSARYAPESPLAAAKELPEFVSPPPVRQLAYLMSCEDEQDQQQGRPIVMQKSRSRNGEFTARLGVMFSPLRLISSHESSNHGCFVTATLSPPHDDGDEEHSTLVKILSPAVELHSSSMKTTRKSKGSWTNHVEMVKSRSSKRRHSSDDSQTMMVTLSKAMKKILSKCTVKRSTSKGKSKMDSPALSPPEFQYT